MKQQNIDQQSERFDWVTRTADGITERFSTRGEAEESAMEGEQVAFVPDPGTL